MRTLTELGEAVAMSRRHLGLAQKDVASRAGVTRESLVRLERGQLAEFGTRKLLAILTVLGLEVTLTPVGLSGSLDELRRERGGA